MSEKVGFPNLALLVLSESQLLVVDIILRMLIVQEDEGLSQIYVFSCT